MKSAVVFFILLELQAANNLSFVNDWLLLKKSVMEWRDKNHMGGD